MPQSSDANLALFNTIGGFATLGVYGWLYGRAASAGRDGHPGEVHSRQSLNSILPMGMMAGGDLGVIVATENGPISVVTPLTGAYPVVTVTYAAMVLKERVTRLQLLSIVLVLIGMYLSPGA